MASSDCLTQCQLYADPVEHLLICCARGCGYALTVARSKVTSHLREKHNMPKELRDRVTHHLKHEIPYTFWDPARVPLRDDGSSVHPKLRVHEGFACRECRSLTVNFEMLSRHISKE
ncbi:hypothetical protein DL95DRAFT_320451, partial [Leptodontidium sp. 2 PMI_412]